MSKRVNALRNVNFMFLDKNDWISLTSLPNMSPSNFNCLINSLLLDLEICTCMWDCICILQIGIIPSICLLAYLMYFWLRECSRISLYSYVIFSWSLSSYSIFCLLITLEIEKLSLYCWSNSFGPILISGVIENSEEKH
jgi:hypothetical protein